MANAGRFFQFLSSLGALAVAIIIETPRLTIRHPEHHDIDELVKIYAARVCARFLGGVTTPEETRQRFERIINLQDGLDRQEKLGTWVIHHKEDNRCIGEAGLNFLETDGIKEVAMHGVLAFPYWGKSSEAVTSRHATARVIAVKAFQKKFG